MEPKTILLSLVGLGAAFAFLTTGEGFKLPIDGLLPGGMTTIGTMDNRSARLTEIERQDGAPLELATLAEGFDRDTVMAMPAALQVLTPAADCALTAPAKGERVVPLLANGSEQPTLVYAYAEDMVLTQAAAGLEHHYKYNLDETKLPKKGLINVRSDLALQLVNLVVPPGPEPVYLILQDRNAGVLWNILPMPGAKVARVVLLSGVASGVVNLPEGAVLETVDLHSDACNGVGAPKWALPQTDGIGRDTPQQDLDAYAAYDRWYRGAFGQPADKDLLHRGASNGLLAGSVPPETAAKATWRGVAGATVHLMPADLVFASGAEEHDAWFIQRAENHIRAAFGLDGAADLAAAVVPVVYERVQ
ncbi:hypothetical protein [Rhodobacter ferrooxidans]|uniref:Uncharacterized protein n=1 Tax=Rhodobacter ferrooxidans TaxID=371731 RepID=C8RW50_9RHOB|nr:hypothetical protein [Rhodobacter sp. SW2]EEW26793.1 hypothetical protein Rsw2DRAFT_0028 [Rhodobacter sp. SW2]